jgi:hypothetical protein
VKPLHLPPLTAEELKPWQDVKTRLGYPRCNAFAHHSQDSDRRDAELMLYAQKAKTASYIVRSTDLYAMNSVVWVRRGYTAAVRL